MSRRSNSFRGGVQQYITPPSETEPCKPVSESSIADAHVLSLIPLFELQTDDPIWDTPTPVTMMMTEDKELFWRLLGANRRKAKARQEEQDDLCHH